MEKLLEKLFDLKKIPVKFIFVIWISSSIILFVPEQALTKLNLKDFLSDYGKYLGIIFIICSGFLIVTISNFITKKFSLNKYEKKLQSTILKNLNDLNIHEQALLREFFIQDKHTLQLPMDDETVIGLENKRIIVRASDVGFTYIHGAYFPYAITNFAKNNLTDVILGFPENMSESDKINIIESRPNWAKEKTRREELFNSRWF